MTTQLVALGKRALALHSIAALYHVEPVIAAVDHIIAIDVSGSMYSDLPALRLQLKNKLASLVKDRDTVTIIWFSGKGQFGVLVEQLEIKSVSDLSGLHNAIDRFLQPQGLTGFKEPLQEVLDVIDRISARRSDSVFSLFFMTDGYDNQWSERDILAVCQKLEPKLATAAIVEYGWNCNRNLLAKMAETLGGHLVFSKDLQEYAVTFEKALGGTVGVKKIPVQLAAKAVLGYAYTLSGSDLLTFVPDETGTVLIPEGVTSLAYFTDGTPANSHMDIALKPSRFDRAVHNDQLIWAGLVTLSQRMDSEAIFEVLAALGDVALVNAFSSCFSKEDYIFFQTSALDCAINPSRRYEHGYNANALPKEDAYTVLELLADLSSSEENLFYPHHEYFTYERIGAETVQKEKVVTFKYGNRDKGYPINGIVWNEDRPNVSVRVRMEGTVALPEDRPAGLPAEVASFVYRNYTIVRDGIVHTRRLPVSLNKGTFEKLQANGLLKGDTWEEGRVLLLEYRKVPVINRNMVRGVTAAESFAQVLELQKLKGAQKVLNEFRDRFIPKESKRFLMLYGQEGTDYLTALGLTDYNGFNPQSESHKSGDFYMAKELKIAAKGLSSLPKVSDVEASLLAGKKLKVSEFVMVEALRNVQEFLESSLYTKAADPKALFGTWVETEARAVVLKTRELMQRLAQNKFSIIVGHGWFKDLPSLDANQLEVELDGFGPVQVTATLKDSQIEK